MKFNEFDSTNQIQLITSAGQILSMYFLIFRTTKIAPNVVCCVNLSECTDGGGIDHY